MRLRGLLLSSLLLHACLTYPPEEGEAPPPEGDSQEESGLPEGSKPKEKPLLAIPPSTARKAPREVYPQEPPPPLPEPMVPEEMVIPEPEPAPPPPEPMVPEEMVIPEPKPAPPTPDPMAPKEMVIPEPGLPLEATPPSDEGQTLLREIPPEEYSLEQGRGQQFTIELNDMGWIFIDSEGDKDLRLLEKRYDPQRRKTIFLFSGSTTPPGGERVLYFMYQDNFRGISEVKSLLLGGEEKPSSIETSPTEEIEGTTQEENAVSLEKDPLETEEAFNGEELENNPSPFLGPGELYELARSYETPGEGQSLEKAMALYEQILRDYPFTEERFKAEERIRYLNRYYFRVQ